jgi:hypothetical protein
MEKLTGRCIHNTYDLKPAETLPATHSRWLSENNKHSTASVEPTTQCLVLARNGWLMQEKRMQNCGLLRVTTFRLLVLTTSGKPCDDRLFRPLSGGPCLLRSHAQVLAGRTARASSQASQQVTPLQDIIRGWTIRNATVPQHATIVLISWRRHLPQTNRR